MIGFEFQSPLLSAKMWRNGWEINAHNRRSTRPHFNAKNDMKTVPKSYFAKSTQLFSVWLGYMACKRRLNDYIRGEFIQLNSSFCEHCKHSTISTCLVPWLCASHRFWIILPHERQSQQSPQCQHPAYRQVTPVKFFLPVPLPIFNQKFPQELPV